MKDTGTLKLTTPTDREIVMTRVFDAPCRLVFEAFSRPELLKRWLLGPPGWEMIVCEVAARVGDHYRYVWRHADGQQMGIGGVCRELEPPSRVVCTELMDGYPGESLVTTVLVEQGGKTTLTTTVLYASREIRDAVLKSGMERGVAASYDRLAELLPTMERGHKAMIDAPTNRPQRIGRSVGAVLTGMLAAIIVTLVTDIVLHATGVFPPWGDSLVGYDGALLLATVYRTVYGVAGSYLTARLAPDRPMQHALVGGVIGLALSIVGAAVTWNRGPAFGPHWYPLALVVLALPTAWAGGKLRLRQLHARADG
jgi:uncharacterized protein YndB with AHSA1/START domain